MLSTLVAVMVDSFGCGLTVCNFGILKLGGFGCMLIFGRIGESVILMGGYYLQEPPPFCKILIFLLVQFH